MSQRPRLASSSTDASTVVNPAYAVLALVGGTLLLAGTRATTYVSTLALAPRSGDVTVTA